MTQDLQKNIADTRVGSLPDSAISEFQDVYERVYKIRLDFDVAKEMARSFMDLYLFTAEEGS